MPGGRPKANIDKEAVRKLAEKDWGAPEIAVFLGVSHRTIVRRFGKVIADGRLTYRTKLRDIRNQAIAVMAKCLETKDGKFVEQNPSIRMSAAKGLASAIKYRDSEADVYVPPSKPGTVNNPNAGVNLKWSVRKSKDSQETMSESDLAEMFKKYVDK